MDVPVAMREAKRRIEHELLSRPGVNGVDIGFKETDGRPTDQLAIRVLVDKKKKVPPAQQIPAEVEGHPTDVIERKFELHQANRGRVEDVSLQSDTGTYDPLKGGCSIGPCRSINGYIYAGTLGAVVRDNATGKSLLLSNFHVMCVDSGWHVGDQMCQPARLDGGSCPANVVGGIARATLAETVDCAVAEITGSRKNVCEIIDIGPINGTAVASIGLAVRKRGRTTALTYGTVDSVDLTVNIDYGDGIGVRTLHHQIGVKPDPAHSTKFSDHGDSGAVVVNQSCQVVGLNFAGDETGYGIANPIADVLRALNVSMCSPVTKTPLKELKDAKHEKIEKLEVKEHKPEKYEKHEKVEIKEHKFEKVEKPEIKEHKPEKYEKIEKIEIKEHKLEKHEKVEIEQWFPKLGEGDPFHPSQHPGFGGLPGAGAGGGLGAFHGSSGLEATQPHFIPSGLRPDLGLGALSGEPDCD
jgi:hypothetical protein